MIDETVRFEHMNWTAASPEENLAMDEALLLELDAEPETPQTLRIWEPETPLVVVGRSTNVALEVDTARCAARGIPILRRISGGASIVAGPGCLMYAVTLDSRSAPELRQAEHAHRWVLERLSGAFQSAGIHSVRRGVSDLAILRDGAVRKVSGNSMRTLRRAVLYHGTLLYDFPLTLIEETLRSPPRQPDYRGRRAHAEFVANLPLDRETLRRVLIDAFAANTARMGWPTESMTRLAKEKYGVSSWNLEGRAE